VQYQAEYGDEVAEKAPAAAGEPTTGHGQFADLLAAVTHRQRQDGTGVVAASGQFEVHVTHSRDADRQAAVPSPKTKSDDLGDPSEVGMPADGVLRQCHHLGHHRVLCRSFPPPPAGYRGVQQRGHGDRGAQGDPVHPVPHVDANHW
jgi:hypothetical protein